MNRDTFYAALRRRESGLFGTSLRQPQVEGMDAILDACAGLPLPCAAYILATAYHETAYTMQPVRETLADTDAKAVARLESAWAKGKLKWVKTPYWRFDADGKTWLGRGYVQLTHKTNYARATKELEIDLVAQPNLAMHPNIAAQILVRGSMEGWFTGRKLSAYMAGDGFDYVNARAVINGDVKGNGAKIAAHAKAFENALREAGWQTRAKNAQVQITTQKQDDAPPSTPQKPVTPQPAPKLGLAGVFLALMAAATVWLSDLVEWVKSLF